MLANQKFRDTVRAGLLALGFARPVCAVKHQDAEQRFCDVGTACSLYRS